MLNELTKKSLDELTYSVVGAAIEVHKVMGRGLLESVYHHCMREELKTRNISFQSELKIPVHYKEKELTIDLRCDFFIENCLVIELKAINGSHSAFEAGQMCTIHLSQVVRSTYMKLLKAPKGILINFNCSNIFNEGQKTYVNEYFKQLKP